MWLGLPDGLTGQSEMSLGGENWPRSLILLCTLLAQKSEMASVIASQMAFAEWDDFSELAVIRHRVAPAIAEAVENCGIVLPGPVIGAIQAEARANGFAALAQRNESLHLAQAFEAVGINAVWLKGWSLAEQLYGAPGLRHSNDIDVLVDADERCTAARCLRDAGYVPGEEHRMRARLIGHPAIRAECKDVQYHNAETGLIVELHWRTSHFRDWPELLDLDERPVLLPGVTGPVKIMVPGPLGQLVYLAGHGQQHMYGRLKWLLDIARIVQQRGLEQLDDDLGRADAAGVGRVVRLALHLAYRVFAAAVPDGARSLAQNEDRWAKKILADIANPAAAPGRPRTRLAFYLWHLRMAETPSQIVGVLRFAMWRRLRLAMAGLTHPERGTDA